MSSSRSATPSSGTGSTTNPVRKLRAHGFGRDLRIRRRREFLSIQKHGRKRGSGGFVVLWLPQSPPGASRFGFSVSRRVGNSVVRNRVKRRLREFVRLNRSEFSAARDFVVIAKPGAANLSCAEISRELHGSFCV